MAEGTIVLGIIGYPIGHSLSPLMHTIAMRHWGIEGCYVPFEVKAESIQAAITGLKALGVRGVNVTVPHKRVVVKYIDELDPMAEATGAVNTISFTSERTVGYNTDGAGFITSVREDAGEEVKGRRVLLIGAGGAARGLAVKLVMEGVAEIWVTNRTPERGEELVRRLREEISYCSAAFIPLKDEAVREILPRVDMLINATSVGMGGGCGVPISLDGIEEKHLVCDIVYTPLETPFLRECRKRGAKTLDGLGMLIYQGDLSFQIWTGKRFPVAEIRNILVNKLSSLMKGYCQDDK